MHLMHSELKGLISIRMLLLMLLGDHHVLIRSHRHPVLGMEALEGSSHGLVLVKRIVCCMARVVLWDEAWVTVMWLRHHLHAMLWVLRRSQSHVIVWLEWSCIHWHLTTDLIAWLGLRYV